MVAVSSRSNSTQPTRILQLQTCLELKRLQLPPMPFEVAVLPSVEGDAVRAGQPLRPYPRVMPCDERNGYFELSVTNVVTVISSLSNMMSRSANRWHPSRVPASFLHLVRRVRFCYDTFPLFRVFPRLWITADPEWRNLLVSRRAFESSTPPSRSDFTVISCIFRFH